MPPFWKLKRESQRIGLQIKGIAERWLDPIAQKSHDRSFEIGFEMTAGALLLGDKVGMLLVFQPDSMQDSVIHTCKYLWENGYSPFIIANGGLNPADKERLLPFVALILERPNFGYDFGGYRDGIKSLWQQGMALSKLIILNDSIWLPLRSNCSFIAQLEAANADISGSILRHRKEDVCFLESYCYLIRKPVLDSDAFRSYWHNLRLTSNKFHVIRRGERGFSKAMQDAGFETKGLYSNNDLNVKLNAQSNAFLFETLTYSCHVDPQMDSKRKNLLNTFGQLDWRKCVFEYIAEAQASAPFYCVFPHAMVNLLDYPILKKSQDMNAIFWRRAYRKAVQDGTIAAPIGAVANELGLTVDYLNDIDHLPRLKTHDQNMAVAARAIAGRSAFGSLS